ncbi:MAG: hypothetical protein IK025_04345 [Bacteroidales bacterium]|nr:hypothetical protein [Bacteroidales bacterium]
MKKLLLTILLCLFVWGLKAQYLETEPPPTPVQRIFYGGDLDMAFGTVTQISLSPQVGYRITNRFSAGLGIDYMFVYSEFYNFKGSIFGGNVFASFTVIKSIGDLIPFFGTDMGILIYGQFSYTNMGKFYTALSGEEPMWIASPMLGLGFQVPIGQRSYMLLTVMYNFDESLYSLYSNPVVKISYQF